MTLHVPVPTARLDAGPAVAVHVRAVQTGRRCRCRRCRCRWSPSCCRRRRHSRPGWCCTPHRAVVVLQSALAVTVVVVGVGHSVSVFAWFWQRQPPRATLHDWPLQSESRQSLRKSRSLSLPHPAHQLLGVVVQVHAPAPDGHRSGRTTCRCNRCPGSPGSSKSLSLPSLHTRLLLLRAAAADAVKPVLHTKPHVPQLAGPTAGRSRRRYCRRSRRPCRCTARRRAAPHPRRTAPRWSHRRACPPCRALALGANVRRRSRTSRRPRPPVIAVVVLAVARHLGSSGPAAVARRPARRVHTRPSSPQSAVVSQL
jgi:hypothetical protein